MNRDHDLTNPLEQSLIARIRQLSAPMQPKPTDVSERIVPLLGIRAVLFDIYGTLFISGSGDISIARARSNRAALSEALQYAGFSGNLEEAGIQGAERLLQAIQQSHKKRQAEGVDYPEVDIRAEWRAVLSFLQQEHVIEGAITTESIARVSVEYEYRVNPVWPMPDLAETLRALQANQIVLGIVSNAQFYTLLLFPAFLGESYENVGFRPELCIWSYELLEAKPSIALFRSVVAALQLHYTIFPAETLYVGNDMLNDMLPVAQLGLKTALFAGDERSLRLRENDPKCSNLTPDVIITNLAQLLNVLCG